MIGRSVLHRGEAWPWGEMSGKSTLMILYGLYIPDAGRSDQGRAGSAKIPAMLLREAVGMVQQHFQLVPSDCS
jgi:ABC-type uncharacterized transport system ATPase subunit